MPYLGDNDADLRKRSSYMSETRGLEATKATETNFWRHVTLKDHLDKKLRYYDQ